MRIIATLLALAVTAVLATEAQAQLIGRRVVNNYYGGCSGGGAQTYASPPQQQVYYQPPQQQYYAPPPQYYAPPVQQQYYAPPPRGGAEIIVRDERTGRYNRIVVEETTYRDFPTGGGPGYSGYAEGSPYMPYTNGGGYPGVIEYSYPSSTYAPQGYSLPQNCPGGYCPGGVCPPQTYSVPQGYAPQGYRPSQGMLTQR